MRKGNLLVVKQHFYKKSRLQSSREDGPSWVSNEFSCLLRIPLEGSYCPACLLTNTSPNGIILLSVLISPISTLNYSLFTARPYKWLSADIFWEGTPGLRVTFLNFHLTFFTE